MTVDTLRLSAEEANRLVARRRGLVGRALPRVPRRDRRARPRAARVPLRLRERSGRGHPDRDQGRDRHARDPDDCRLEDPRELRPGLRRDRDRELPCARPARDRQDEHRRVRDGLVDRELGVRPVAQPVGPDARPRRLGRRQRGRRLGRARAVGTRLRHRRLDQAAGRALRSRRACGRRTARSRATASSRSRRRSTRSVRSRGTFATARSSTRSSRAATRTTRRPSTCLRSSCRRRKTSRACASACPRR